MQRWLGPALIDAGYSFDPLVDEPDSLLAPNDLIRACLWQRRVLLIELRARFPITEPASHVSVVDADSGRLLGHFPGAQSYGRFPLAWRPIRPRILDMDGVEGPPG